MGMLEIINKYLTKGDGALSERRPLLLGASFLSYINATHPKG